MVCTHIMRDGMKDIHYHSEVIILTTYITASPLFVQRGRHGVRGIYNICVEAYIAYVHSPHVFLLTAKIIIITVFYNSSM